MTTTLYQGDCIKVINSIKLDRDIDLVVVDLPYGQTVCEWDIKINLEEMWKALKRICKKNCIYVFFCTTKFGYEIIKSNPKWFRYDIVWKKGEQSVGFLNAKKQPLRNHEMLYVFRNNNSKNPTYNPQMVPGKPYDRKKVNDEPENTIYGQMESCRKNNKSGLRYPKSVLNYINRKDSRKNKNPHPTQKPTELLEWIIKSYSNEGELVMDFCMGSGSTGIACKNTNRDFIGIEMNDDYFNSAKEWIEGHNNDDEYKTENEEKN